MPSMVPEIQHRGEWEGEAPLLTQCITKPLEQTDIRPQEPNAAGLLYATPCPNPER